MSKTKKVKKNPDGSVTITETRTIKMDESKKAEARADLVKLYNPTGGFSLCANDGYFAKSIEQKYGMPLSTLAEVSGYNDHLKEYQRRKARAMAGFSW